MTRPNSGILTANFPAVSERVIPLFSSIFYSDDPIDLQIRNTPNSLLPSFHLLSIPRQNHLVTLTPNIAPSPTSSDQQECSKLILWRLLFAPFSSYFATFWATFWRFFQFQQAPVSQTKTWFILVRTRILFHLFHLF